MSVSTSETRTFDVPTAVKTALPATQPAVSDPAQWHTATVSTLIEVEQLLDQVEREGYHEHELTVLGPDVFVVRWR
jgi:hypothetical protein